MKKKNNNYDEYNTDMINIASKEEEILNSYYNDEEVYKTRRNKKEDIVLVEEPKNKITFEDEEEIEEFTMAEEIKPVVEEIIEEKHEAKRKNKQEIELEYLDLSDEEEEIEETEKKKKTPYDKAKLIINIAFIIIMVILAIIAIDVISVARYDKGPYFAIKTKTYKDGGTKVYTGLGYKVIKYNQLQGRKDMVVGSWFMKYDIEPLTTNSFDLAIEFANDETTAYKYYYKKFIRISSDLVKVDEEKRTIDIGYIDEDGKYTLNIKCKMDPSYVDIEYFEKNEEITVIGTVSKYKFKKDGKPGTLYLENCYAEQ